MLFKKTFLILLTLATTLVFAGRLFYIQIVDDSLKDKSLSNAVKKETIYPERGKIYDRNGKLLVSNQPSYDLMFIPNQLKAFDTLELAQLLQLSPEDITDKIAAAKRWSWRRPSVLVGQLKKNEYGGLQEKLYKFEGFYIQKRMLRKYHIDHSANVLGYISEVSQHQIDENSYYESGDLIGKDGIEKYYEDLLRGEKGKRLLLTDKFNRVIAPYQAGKHDSTAVSGKNLQISIDAELQAYGTLLMQGKRGGIVAIEPETGEILCLITAPSYDPERLVGRERSAYYTKLYYDSISRPLFDRGLQGEYPPGSPFKILTALIGLQEGAITPNSSFGCNHGYYYSSTRKMGCHAHSSPLQLINGIAESCNSYFAQTYRRIIEKYPTPSEGTNRWSQHLESFNLNQFLGYDLPVGKRGLIPDADFYNRYYPNGGWRAPTTISNSIGQGEVLMTPIQMANVMAAVANKGWFIKPHFLKTIDNQANKDSLYTTKNYTSIEAQHFEPIIEGMHQVYKKGTAKYLQSKTVEICGKTGTAENFVKIDGNRMQLTDHSLFTAFAPKENPKIAIAVIVENGYWGSRYAGRIATLMIEKYLLGEVTRTDLETWILNNSLEEEYQKPYLGKEFRINQ
ncbi:MAG: penicillin-binding protein 2 [Flavobacteriaceae bacterium]|nr:penicillin-binding protein 2 [Flavobacteriaceae bacterium]